MVLSAEFSRLNAVSFGSDFYTRNCHGFSEVYLDRFHRAIFFGKTVEPVGTFGGLSGKIYNSQSKKKCFHGYHSARIRAFSSIALSGAFISVDHRYPVFFMGRFYPVLFQAGREKYKLLRFLYGTMGRMVGKAKGIGRRQRIRYTPRVFFHLILWLLPRSIK